MRLTFKYVFTLLTTIGTCGFASLASAGSAATIIYGPRSTAVPTLSGNLLIALALLLMLVAFRLLKDRRQSGTHMVIAITAITALVAGAGGIKLVTDAHAIDAVLEMNDEDGGVIQVPGPGNWEIYNLTNAPQGIIDIQYVMGCSDQPPVNGAEAEALNGGAPSVGPCTTSTTLAPQSAEFCTLEVFCEF